MPSDPTARYEGWWDYLFGEPTRHAAQPSSRGPLLGAGAGYRAMPEMKASIEDVRDEPFYSWSMKNPGKPLTKGDLEAYPPSPVSDTPLGSLNVPGADMMLGAPYTADPQQNTPEDVRPYLPSFQRGWKPPYSRQAPYSQFKPSDWEGYPGESPTYGPRLPPQSNLPSEDWEHLPIAPGDPGWTPPPSVSGPHNRAGDPPRPGYDRPVFGGYDVTPVDHNPFGAMATSPNDYDVESVDHNPFAVGYQEGGGVTDLGSVDRFPTTADVADKYITRSGQLVPQINPSAPTTATSMLADKYTSGSQISDPEWMNYQEDLAQAEQRTSEWGAATETFHPQTMNFIQRTGGTLPAARAAIQKMYPNGPEPEAPDVIQRAYSDLIGGRRQFSGSPVSQGGRGRLADIGVFGSSPLMAPRLVGHPGYQLRDPFAEQYQPQLPPEEGRFWHGGRVGFQSGGVTDLGEIDPDAGAPVPDAPPPAQSPFSVLDKRTADWRAAQPQAQPPPEAPQKQYYGGAWGQSAEDAYQTAAGGIGSAIDWLGNKFESGVGTTAATLGMPAPAMFARDLRGLVFESGELGPRGEPRAPPRKLNPSGFYSHGADVAASLPQTHGTTQQLVAQLVKRGVKPEELRAAGLDDLSDMPPTSHRDELADMFHGNQPNIQETRLSNQPLPSELEAKARQLYEQEGLAGEGGVDWDYAEPHLRTHFRDVAGGGEGSAKPPQYEQYTLPGGENYRELLLHTPEDDSSQAFLSTHWDQPNVLAHLRMSDRAGPNGEKLLHLEELQSDWGQQGREKGFKLPHGEYLNQGNEFTRQAAGVPPERQNEIFDQWNRLHDAQTYGVPSGPFVGTTQGWTDLGLKRALIEGARGGYDGIIWTPGEEQAARYPGLVKHIDELHYEHGGTRLVGYDPEGNSVWHGPRWTTREELPSVVGQDLAAKLLAQEPKNGWRTLENLNVKLGEEGMKGYYDKILPNRLANLTKKLDPSAKIGTTRSESPSESGGKYSRVFPHLPLTPLMREQILKGLPQYARGGAVAQNEGLRGHIEMLQRPRHAFADGGAPTQDDFTANAQARAQDEAKAEQWRQAHQDQYPKPEAPQAEPQTWYGRWGQTLGGELSAGLSGLDYAGGKAADFAASVAANPVGYGPLSFRTMSPESEAYVASAIKGAGSELLSDPMLGGDMINMPRAPEAVAPRAGQVGSDITAGASAPRAQVMDLNGVKRHIDPEFPESRVGTSVATNSDPNAAIEAEQAAHANNKAHVGVEMTANAPGYVRSVANMVRNGRIPYVKVPPGATDAQIVEALTQHMTDNISGLYRRVSSAVQNGSRLWYEGAHSRSRGIAVTHDIPHENAAGVVASMSPQKDWDQNVTLADWVAHTAGTTAPDATMSQEMTDWVNRYALRKDPERVEVDPTTGKEIRYNTRTGEVMSPNSVSRQDVLTQLAEVSDGKTWAQMTPEQQSFYTRAYYEAHGPPDHLMPISDADYRWVSPGGRTIEINRGDPLHWLDDKGDRKYGYYINNPDGTHNGVNALYGDEYTNAAGQPIPVSWGSVNEAANAIRSFGAQSMSDISEALGNGHKVRSFFNNIIAPWSKKGDLTSDTHAVAAALLRPLGASAPEAASGMGAASPSHAETGMQGFYPYVAEAYRRAARKAGVLPREMQSITWEALRGIWSPKEKMAKSNVKKGFTSQTDITNGVWQAYHNDQMTMDQVHNAILGPNGEKIRNPRWFGTFRPAGSQP